MFFEGKGAQKRPPTVTFQCGQITNICCAKLITTTAAFSDQYNYRNPQENYDSRMQRLCL